MKNILNIKRTCILCCLLVMTSVYVAAQDVNFQVSIDRNQVSVGGRIQLTVTVEGADVSTPMELPDIPGFRSSYLGPSTQIQVVNGKYFKKTAFRYILQPQAVGQYTIPPLSMQIQGLTYASKPIEVEVVEGSAQLPSLNQQGSQNFEGLENRLFLTIETPRKEVRLHEKIPVTIKLYVQELPVRDIEFPQLSNIGFDSDEFGKPLQYTDVIGGMKYHIVEFKINLYPTRTGELNIGPAVLNASVLVRGKSRGASFGKDPLDSLFDDHDLFDSFFNRVSKQPVELKSYDIPVKVLPLPEEGKPVDFSGGVGQFTFDFSAGPLEVKVGDPITVKVQVKGEGSLGAVNMPSYQEDDNFKVYDPQVKEESGSKILEQVLIPKNDTIKEIPPLTFSFFDPEAKAYKSIKRGPFAITVEKGEGEPEFKVIELSREGQSREVESLGRDLIYIKSSFGQWQKRGASLIYSLWFKVFLLLPTIVFILLHFIYLRRNRLKDDVAFARRMRAPKKAHDGLRKARTLMAENKYREFYDQIFTTAQEYFGDKLYLPAGELTYQELESSLKNKNLNPEMLTKLKTFYDACDEARFASLSEDKQKAQANLNLCEEIIDYCERTLR